MWGWEGESRGYAQFYRKVKRCKRPRAPSSRAPLVAQLLVASGPDDDQGLYRLATRSPKDPARSARASQATAGQAGSFTVWTGVLAWTGVLRTNEIQYYVYVRTEPAGCVVTRHTIESEAAVTRVTDEV